MMGYTNGHMAQKNSNFKNFKIINLLKRPWKCEMLGDQGGNCRQTGAKLLKKY